MPDCELLSTCPFFSDNPEDISKPDEIYGLEGMSELKAMIKSEYCRGNYTWCGRYMAFKELERQQNIVKSTVALVFAK